MTERVRGYVLGEDILKGRKVWRVRIRDRFCKLDGKKLVVNSIPSGVTLTSGKSITFFVGSPKDGHYQACSIRSV